MERADPQTTPWPVCEGFNQPDARLIAETFNEPPKNKLEALNIALNMATSCLTTCAVPEDYSGSNLEQTRKYAIEVIQSITYLRLVNWEKHHD